MPEPATLVLFAAAALALLVTPGPSVLYIVSQSLEQGQTAGLVSVLGITLGTLLHVLAAALGLSALLASSPLAYDLVKYAGALYLVFLGLRKLLRGDGGAPDAPARASLPQVFGQGVIVNLLNPKTALFVLAFLPQFADPLRGGVGAQILVLGGLLALLGLLSDGAYALLAGRLEPLVRGRFGGRWHGLVYLALGLTAAFTGRSARV